MAVHQLVPNFVSGDATGQAAVQFQAILRRVGHYGELFAEEVEPGLASWVKPASTLRPEKDDWVFYHHGIASPLSGALLHLPCRRAVVYHNVTPARFYQGTPLWEPLLAGRAQLSAMAPHVDLAIGVSQFNSAELVAAGYRNVHTVPLFIEPRRFGEDKADRTAAARLRRRSPTLIAVSRVMPHKRFEDVLALHREVLRLRSDARLLIAGGYQPGGAYFRGLTRTAKEIPNVFFLGRLSHAQLVAAYRSASVFISMSEHEGFGLPLLEAMAAELPVLAFAAAAVPETLGGAGVAFDEKRFAFLAELVDELNESALLRRAVLRGERRRLRELSSAVSTERMAKALGSAAANGARGMPAFMSAGQESAVAKGARRAPRLSAERMAEAPGWADKRMRPAARRGRPRVAIVVQRYGELTGGAEKHAEEIAHRMAEQWSVTVLTTCAKDHLTWANEFPPGESRDGQVRVLRFPTLRAREMSRFNGFSRELYTAAQDRVREEHWIWEQGPQVPQLLRHLSECGDHYDGFVFFTYLYLPTAWGLPMVARRALLVPTAHDEPALKFEAYADALELPRALMCNTPEEQELIHSRFPNHARARIVGVGVESNRASPGRFRQKHGIERAYLLYVGRVEQGKGVGYLLQDHASMLRRDSHGPDLVLAGDASMEVSGERVHYLGRISEEDKFDAIAGALAVVIPSRFESLSLVALEAFAQRTPVLVNGRSPVLTGQVRRSGAGFVYFDRRSFAEGVREIAAARRQLGRKAAAYARKHRWARVVNAYKQEMRRIWEASG